VTSSPTAKTQAPFASWPPKSSTCTTRRLGHRRGRERALAPATYKRCASPSCGRSFIRERELRCGTVVSGKTGYGRAGSGQLFGGAEATLAALRDLGYTLPFYLLTVISVATVRGCRSS